MNESIKSIEAINPKSTDVIVLRFNKIPVEELGFWFEHVQKKFPNNTVVALPSSAALEMADKEYWEDYIKMTYEIVKAMP